MVSDRVVSKVLSSKETSYIKGYKTQQYAPSCNPDATSNLSKLIQESGAVKASDVEYNYQFSIYNVI